MVYDEDAAASSTWPHSTLIVASKNTGFPNLESRFLFLWFSYEINCSIRGDSSSSAATQQRCPQIVLNLSVYCGSNRAHLTSLRHRSLLALRRLAMLRMPPPLPPGPTNP